MPEERKAADVIAAAGLAVGGVFGMAGTFAGSDWLRQALWLIDGVALVVATALLAVKFLREDRDLAAAGFLALWPARAFARRQRRGLAGERSFLRRRRRAVVGRARHHEHAFFHLHRRAAPPPRA